MSDSTAVEYRIDAADRITEVNHAWCRFADENGGADLLPPRIYGMSVWGFLADPTTIALYQMIFRRVRTSDPVSFAFRCDGPGIRRLLGMRIESRPDRSVHCAVRPIAEQPRPPVPLFDPAVSRGEGLVTVCSWCKRVRAGDDWLEVEAAVVRLDLFRATPPPMLTHGICPPCRAAMGNLEDPVRPAPESLVLGPLSPA